MVLSPSSIAPQQPPYGQHDGATTVPAEDPTTTLLGMGAYCAVFALIIPTRVIYDQTASLPGSAHLYRGFLASVAGGVSDLVAGYKRMWQEEGPNMFVKWPLIGVGIGVLAFAVQEGVQQACHELFHVTQEDIDTRSRKWYLSKMLGSIVSGSLIYPLTITWTFYTTKRLPSWRVYFRDLVLRGKDYFYTSLPLSAFNFLVFFLNDVIRAKLLHWHKTTFFPDLIPHSQSEDLEYYEPAPGTHEGGHYRPVLFQASNFLVFSFTTALATLLTSPLELITLRLISHPSQYGPLGILGTCKSIWREEGFWGFYKGLLLNSIFLTSTYYAGIEEEADSGHPPV